MFVELATVLLFPAVMAFAGMIDMLTMTIPNRVPLILLAGFALLAPFSGLPWSEIGLHAGVGFAALVVGLFCFARGWIGGGDAKLFAAAALWFGYQHLLEFALVTAIIGGALTLVILFGRSVPLPAWLARQAWLARLHDAREGIPYGIALACGALVVYPQTAWVAGQA